MDWPSLKKDHIPHLCWNQVWPMNSLWSMKSELKGHAIRGKKVWDLTCSWHHLSPLYQTEADHPPEFSSEEDRNTISVDPYVHMQREQKIHLGCQKPLRCWYHLLPEHNQQSWLFTYPFWPLTPQRSSSGINQLLLGRMPSDTAFHQLAVSSGSPPEWNIPEGRQGEQRGFKSSKYDPPKKVNLYE